MKHPLIIGSLGKIEDCKLKVSGIDWGIWGISDLVVISNSSDPSIVDVSYKITTLYPMTYISLTLDM
jgi:hypothetical protein